MMNLLILAAALTVGATGQTAGPTAITLQADRELALILAESASLINSRAPIERRPRGAPHWRKGARPRADHVHVDQQPGGCDHPQSSADSTTVGAMRQSPSP